LTSITAYDQYGNVLDATGGSTPYTGAKTLTFTGAATIGANVPTVEDKDGAAVNFGTNTVITFTNGAATIGDAAGGQVVLYKAEASITIVADAAGLAHVVASSGMPAFNVGSAAADHLVFTTQPAGSVSGFALTTQPVVEARDHSGNKDIGYVTNVIASENEAGTLTGTTTQAAVAGVATFTNLVYTATADGQVFQIDVASGSLTPATSNNVVSHVVTYVAPANFGASYLHISPEQVAPGQQVEISGNIGNSGGQLGSYTAALVITGPDGTTTDSQTVTVSPNAATKVSFTVQKSTPGTYSVNLAGMQGQFTVTGGSAFGGGLGTGGMVAIVVIIIALIVGLVFIFRRV
jgi:hypothetical protein